MMRSKFLADVYLGEKGFEHGGRLPLDHHPLEFRAHVGVLVPGVASSARVRLRSYVLSDYFLSRVLLEVVSTRGTYGMLVPMNTYN